MTSGIYSICNFALDDCKLAQSRNPRSATATFLDAISLFAEWEEKEL
jgi:hypothetical protein